MKNKKNNVSKYKNRIFSNFLEGLVYGLAIGLILGVSPSNSIPFGFLICSFILSIFGVLDKIFWRFKGYEKRKKTKK